jgi:hypothetical protein
MESSKLILTNCKHPSLQFVKISKHPQAHNLWKFPNTPKLTISEEFQPPTELTIFEDFQAPKAHSL